MRLSAQAPSPHRPGFSFWRRLGLAVGLAWLGLSAQAGTITATGAFDPAQAGRPRMDRGAVWNGSAIVSPTNGDQISFTLGNATSTSFDVKPQVSIPTGMTVITSGANQPSITSSGCGTAPTLSSFTLSAGVLSYNLASTGLAGSGYDMADGCSITLRFKVIASASTPVGTSFFNLSWSQASVDGGPVDPAPTPVPQPVQVEAGATTLDKLPTNQIRAVGATAEWLTGSGQGVTVTNTGIGGLFNVTINESAINPGGSLALTSLTTPTAGASCAAGVCTLPYLAPGANFQASVQATVTGCVSIGNTVSSTDLTGATAKSRFAQVTLDLPAPNVSVSAPGVTLNYNGAVPVTVTVANGAGAGTANSLTVQSNLHTLGVTVSGVAAGWTYNAGNGLFTYTPGSLPGGTSLPLTFNLAATNICGGGVGGLAQWTATYTNACGASFVVPTITQSISPPTIAPTVTLGKAASAPRVVVGETASYVVSLNATQTSLISGTDLVVTDTLPAGMTGVSLSASAGSFTCSGACTGGSLVTWTVPKTSVPATLTIGFTAPTGVCNAGNNLANTASVTATSVASCSLNASASASQLLTNNPGGAFVQDYNVSTPTGSFFEAGTGDLNNNGSRDNQEGEFVTAVANYAWGPGSSGTFSGSTYQENFAAQAGAQLVSNLGVRVRLASPSAGALGAYLTVPSASITCVSGSVAGNNCQGGFTVDLAFLAGASFFNDNNVDDKRLEITYAMTFPDASVPDAGTVTRTTLATLNVSGASSGCAGTTYTQGDFVPLARARADVAVTVPQVLDVCEPFTATSSVSNRNEELIGNLLLTLLNGSGPYQIPSSPAETLGGFFSGNATWAHNGGTNPTVTLTPSLKMASTGSVSFPAFLGATATTTPVGLSARADYDDHQTFDTLAPDFAGVNGTTGSAAPNLVRKADLKATVSPQNITVSGNKVQWLFYLTNAGNGVARNATVTQNLPSGLVVNLADTNAANAPIVATSSGGGLIVTYDVGTLQPGQQVALTLVADVSGATCSITGGTPATSVWGCGSPFVAAQTLNSTLPNFIVPNGQMQITTNSSESNCPLCGTARHVVRLRNTGQASIYNPEVTEVSNPATSGLVLGTVEYSVDGGATYLPIVGAFTGAGTSGDPYRVTSANIPPMAELVPLSQAGGGRVAEVLVRFSFATGDLTNASSHAVTTAATANTACGAVVNTGNSTFTLGVSRPNINVTKTGINRTVAGGAATSGSFVATVYGGATDVVDWRVRVTNSGPVAAQNVRLTDLFAGSGAASMQLCNQAGGCADNYASATTVTTGTPVVLPNLAAGETRDLYLREVLGTVCLTPGTNTAQVVWGCTPTSTLSTPTSNTGTAQLITGPNFTSPTITVTSQPNGRARVTYTITNTGGSVSDAVITATIPSRAVLDETYTAPQHATFSVAGPLLSSVTGLTRGGTASTPTWTVNGVFRNGQTLTLVYYLLPTNNAGAPFNDTTAASSYPTLTVAETVAASLDPALPTSQTLSMQIAAGVACPASNNASTALDLNMPDLDITLVSTGNPNRLIATTTIGSTHQFNFRITNNGEAGSIADNFTFRIPITGTAWGFSTAPTANVTGATLTTFGCAVDGGDRLCTFTGSIPEGASLDIQVNLTLQSLVNPMEQRVELRSQIRAHDGSAWGEHSFDRAAYRTIGAVLTKTQGTTTDPVTTGANLAIGEEVPHTNALNIFGAGSNTVSTVLLRDLVPTSSNWLGYVSHSVTSGTATATTVPSSVTNGQVNLTFQDITTGSAVMTFDTQSRALNQAALGASQTTNTRVGASFNFLGANFRSADFGTCTTSATQVCDNTNLRKTSSNLTIRKPQPTLVKQVRNRTQNSPWSAAINANAGDVIEFRLTVSNPALSGGVPMRNLVFTDTLDANLVPLPLATDGLDNDGDGAGAEGNITGQVVTISDANASNPLLAQLPAGSSLTVQFAATSNVAIPGETIITNTGSLTWSSLSGTDATSYVGVQTASPGAPSTLSGEFVATLNAQASVNFTRLGGRVYIDANHNASLDSGETLGTPYSSAPSSGPTLYAKLLRNGVFYQEVTVAANGAFAFGSLPADPNWRLLITPVPGAAAITPQLPPGYIGTQNAAFFVDFAHGTDAALMPPFFFGIYRGVRIDGRVIRDNGANGGTAHNAVLDGGEVPIPGVSVCATTSAACGGGALDAAITDGGGRFSLYVPAASLASSFNLIEVNPTGHLSVGGAPGTLPATTYSLPADTFTVGAGALSTGNTYGNLIFGDVLSNGFSPNQTRQALPATQVLMPHTYVAQTTGSVTFDIASATSSPTGTAFTDALYRDHNCNGQLDPGDDILTAPVAMRAPDTGTAPALTNPAIGTPSLVCVLVRQFVPAEAGQGASRTVVPRAVFTLGGGLPDQTLTLQDITTVGAGATGLELIKAVDQAQAARGATLTYTLTFVNHSAAPITNLSIHDVTPPYTGFLNATWSGAPASLGTCTKTTPVAPSGVGCGVGTGENPVGQVTGAIRWTFTGTLNPGDTGVVTFQVRIDP